MCAARVSLVLAAFLVLPCVTACSDDDNSTSGDKKHDDGGDIEGSCEVDWGDDQSCYECAMLHCEEIVATCFANCACTNGVKCILDDSCRGNACLSVALSCAGSAGVDIGEMLPIATSGVECLKSNCRSDCDML